MQQILLDFEEQGGIVDASDAVSFGLRRKQTNENRDHLLGADNGDSRVQRIDHYPAFDSSEHECGEHEETETYRRACNTPAGTVQKIKCKEERTSGKRDKG